MSSGPPDHLPSEEEARLIRLAPLIPPLVHRLNNALAVVRGACDLALARSFSTQLRRASEETVRLADSLALLSICAKPLVPADTLFDLISAARNAFVLIEPLASRQRVELVERGDSRSMIVRGDAARLGQVLVWLTGETLGPEPTSSAGSVLRLRVDRVDSWAQLTLLHVAGSPGAEPDWSAALDAARELVGRSKGRVECRSRPGGISRIRLAYPILSDPQSKETVETPSGTRRRVLLLEGDESQRDLTRTVLEESGYEVHAPDAPLPAPRHEALEAVDLVLVDADLVRRRPGLLGEVAAGSSAGHDSRVALLGQPFGEGGGRSYRFLAEPYRPGELLGFVESILE